MAWRSGGRTNRELIDNLFKNGLINSEVIRDAMSKIDRAHYTPHPRSAYEDSPQPIGHSATISAPHMHASALESLLPFLQPGRRVLDIGSGSGYLTAVICELIFPTLASSSSSSSSPQPRSQSQSPGANIQGVQTKDGEEGESADQGHGIGKVVGLEHIRELKDLGKGNMEKSERGRRLLEEGKAEFVLGDGRLGWTEQGGEEWDAIHVGAAAKEIHSRLVEGLRRPGRMFIPVEDAHGRENQYIWVVDKDINGVVKKKMLYGVRYVPLTDAPK